MIKVKQGNLINALAHEPTYQNDFFTYLKNNILKAHQNVLKHTLAGFYHLPEQSAELTQKVKKLWPAQKYKHTVILGIGGSSLGPRVIAEVCQYLTEANARPTDSTFEVIDHLNSLAFKRITDPSRLAQTLFIVISKSGGTTETLAGYSVVHEALNQAQLPPAQHFLFLTSDPKSILGQIAQQLSIPTISLPENVGGRFCVLGEVGLVSCLGSAGGFAYDKMMSGAQQIKAQIEQEIEFYQKTNSFSEGLAQLAQKTPLTLTAMLIKDLESLKNYNVHTLFIYHEYLKTFGQWYVQLFGESLGKKTASQTSVGLFPTSAVGPADQHSLLQYLMEGKQKVVTGFVSVLESSERTLHPPLAQLESLKLLENVGLHELTQIECASTFEALLETQKSAYQIELQQLDEAHLGGLFFMQEYWAAFMGFALQIDPFDQPGVELSKVFIKGKLKNKTQA